MSSYGRLGVLLIPVALALALGVQFARNAWTQTDILAPSLDVRIAGWPEASTNQLAAAVPALPAHSHKR